MLSNLGKLRNTFLLNAIDGYIISTKDEFQSEYPPEYNKRLEHITGFTGSNGLAIILKDIVLFFTDGRYLTQCKNQLDSRIFEVFDQKLLTNFFWEKYICSTEVIGYDPNIFTNNSLLSFKKLKLKSVLENLIDKIWYDRPKFLGSKIYNYDIKYSGQSSEDKIVKCREFLSTHHAELLIITNPESVCWLFNVRASDVEFSPILLANAYVTMDEAEYIQNNATLTEKISRTRGKILFDETSCSKYLSDLIKQKWYKSVPNPCILWKACKNKVEIRGMIEGHIQDGIAVCEFLAFLDNEDISNYSEYDLGLKLTKIRSNRLNYISDSFPAIIGFNSNGAIIHYRALEGSAKKIYGDGLLLIDSGGQYYGATTDVTRIVAIGTVKAVHQEYYTKILKGHLALAMIKFPANSVSGANLDVLARQFLWEQGDDYAHSTGHGVGSFLSVHEDPQNINLNAHTVKLCEGMVVSNEPGFYMPGEFGIRIENLMYITKNNINDSFLQFQMLTLVPYEKDLIKFTLLTSDELKYLKNYYQNIRIKILPYLSERASLWLRNQLELEN